MASYVNKGVRAGALTRSIFLNLVATTITAKAGGTKPLATPVTSANVNIGVCATANDSVLLPTPRQGDVMFLNNSGAASAQVFGAGTTTINGVATGTGVALANGKFAFLTAYAAGAWTMVVLN